MYNRDNEEHEMKQRNQVEAALDLFKLKGYESTAGFDILRYANKGLLETKPGVDPNVFLSWYPLNQGYVILRLARAGLLQYKKQNV